MTTASLIQELLRPGAYVPPVAEVGFLQTHISLLFFAGERVYKVKKPVDLGFLDYTTLERRQHFCEEEVRLNQRLAEGVYLGVAAIVRAADGHLRIEAPEDAGGPPSPTGRGEVVEWAVAMRRLPERQMLSSLLERGEIDNQRVNDMAALLASFHRGAASGPGVDEHGAPPAIAANERENFEQLERFRGDLITPLAHDYLRARRLGWLDAQRELLERRVREHRVREGHGDLHASNICFTEGGLVAYDCIEFNRRFRCADVAADVAFLTMDLDYRGYPGFSGDLARRYALAAEDPDMRALERFYKGYRAIVRGKVAALTSVDPDLEAERRGALRAEAMRYFQLAAAYELPPAMILTCGLPGSGKSWLARRLAGALRAAVLRSDVRRKVLAGVPRTTHVPSSYGTGLYAPDMQVRTYRSLLADALRHLRAGHSVIVDATFARRDYRRPFVEAAARLGLPCHVAHVSAPEAVIRERLERRGADDREASDADLAVYLRARESFEPPTEVPPECLLEVTSGAGLPEVAGAQVIDGMIARATARAENEALLPRRST